MATRDCKSAVLHVYVTFSFLFLFLRELLMNIQLSRFFFQVSEKDAR